MNKKEKCPKCGRILRTKNFVVNKKTGEWMCKQCDKKIGNNKFYIPPEKFRERIAVIGKFTVSDTEKDMLHSQFMAQGLDSTQAWQRVYKHIGMLRKMRRVKKAMVTRQRNIELAKKKQDEEINRKFKQSFQELTNGATRSD